MKSNFKNVTDILRSSGFTVLELKSGNNGQIAFLPDFGRVIGLWTSREDNSLLWYNPEFTETISRNSPLDASYWANPGGDRLWLSPERDFFISDYSDPWGSYSVPTCIDPGDYTYITDDNTIELHNGGIIKGYESGSETPFKTTRKFRSLSESEISIICNNPLLGTAGYTEEITLELTSGFHAPVSFWNLSQVPKGGTVLMGITSNTPDVVEYIGNIDGSIGISTNEMLPVSFSGDDQYKIGLTSDSSSGFLAYLRNESDLSTLLIRTFSVCSDADYIDVPPDGRPGAACPVQLYYGGDTYNFGELEYHSPALTRNSNTQLITGSSCLYAFSGDEPDLIQVLENLRSIQTGTR
jgi:hypothetical protein